MKSVKGTLRKGFVVLLGFMLIQAFIASRYLADSKRDIAISVQQNFEASTQLAELATLGETLRRCEKEYFIYLGNVSRREAYSTEWQKTYDQIVKALQGMPASRTAIWTRADLAEVDKWYASAIAYGDGFDAVRKRVETGEIADTQAANGAIREAKDKFRVYLKGTTETLKRKNAESQALAAKINERFDIILLASWSLSGAACLLLILMGVIVPRSIDKPIQTLADAAESMSSGNLERPFRLASSVKEFRALADHLERMRIAQKGLLDSLTRRHRAGQAVAR